MSSLAYLAPVTVQEAVTALTMPGARALGGGTDLLVQMKSGRAKPQTVVDLKRIDGAMGIRETADGFVIGALTPCAALTEHAGLVAAWPGVVEGAGLIGSTQVQGRATMAGNLCNASPAADSVPALIAARAVAIVAGPDGQREVAVEDIPAGPGRNSLSPGEFVFAIRLPAKAARASDSYLRFIPRTEMDIAVVGAGVSLTLDADGRILSAGVALGAVAPTALRVTEAESLLVGTRLEPEILEQLASAARAVCRPISDKRGTVDYRIRTAGVLVKRAAVIAYQRAGGAA